MWTDHDLALEDHHRVQGPHHVRGRPVRPRRLRVGVLLPRRLEHPRFVKVQTLSPRSHEHVFVVRAPDDLDADVETWLREAYQVGSRSGRVG